MELPPICPPLQKKKKSTYIILQPEAVDLNMSSKHFTFGDDLYRQRLQMKACVRVLL